jgi:TfoX/Sxy family transcriptional regulator of competence genes
MAERKMPTFTKSPPALVERFRDVLSRFPDVQQRQMFGFPAAFIGGNMVTSLFNEHWVVRLPDADREQLLAIKGSGPFAPMAGREMKGYAIVPPSIVADDAALDGWLERAFAHGRSLPPKKK